MAKKQGKGTTIAFVGALGTLAAVAIKDVDAGSKSVDMLDAADMTSTYMEKLGSELIELGSVTIEIFHDPILDVQSLIGDIGALTLTSPKSVSGSAAAEVETGQAVLNSYTKKKPLKELMTASVTFTWTGDATYSYTAEA